MTQEINHILNCCIIPMMIVIQMWMLIHYIRIGSHRKTKNTSKNKLSICLTLSFLICGLLNMIWYFVTSITQIHDHITLRYVSCYLFGLLSCSLYHIFKSLIYFALFNRVYESYKGGIMAYNKIYFVIIIVTLTFWTILNLILISVLYKIESSTNKQGYCEYRIHVLYAISLALMDITAISFSSYLFAKPICSLNKYNQNLKSIIIKHLILSCVANLNTLLFYCITFIQELIFGEIMEIELHGSLDIVISSLCVLWMCPQYQQIVNNNKIIKCCIQLAIKPNVNINTIQLKSPTIININIYDDIIQTNSANKIPLKFKNPKSNISSTFTTSIDGDDMTIDGDDMTKSENITVTITSTNILTRINETAFPPFELSEEYTADLEIIYVVLLKLKLIISIDSIVQIISQYAATIYRACIDCDKTYGYIDCSDDYLLVFGTWANCNPLCNEDVRYFLNCDPSFSNTTENSIRHFDEIDNVLCDECSVQWRCSVCNMQFSSESWDNIIVEGCDICESVICEECGLCYDTQVLCPSCCPEKDTFLSYKSMILDTSYKSNASNNNVSSWGKFEFSI
eukprot:172933_1